MISSLKKLFAKEDRFLNLLEASAREGCASVKALSQIMTQPPGQVSLSDIMKSRAEEKRISSEIDELLCQSFTTPLEREDIETLARALYKIPKSIKKFAERYVLSGAQVRSVNFSEQVKNLELATETVRKMVGELREGANLPRTEADNNKLQKIEGEADEVLTRRLEELYMSNQDPLQAIMLKDLYELLERVFDRCRTAGNIVLQIVLKNS